MLKWLQNIFYSLKFYLAIVWGKVRSTKRAPSSVRKTDEKDFQTRAEFEHAQQQRSVFHSLLKEGDEYKCGESTVTLAKFGVEGKQEVAKKIAAADKRREDKQKFLTERGEKIMLMSPDELQEFKINEWLENRNKIKNLIKEFEENSDDPPTPDANVRIN